ncbi:hypothetical protein EON66_10950 [archaeon]|nr:MAG: hypothetical protein EON66_10950 [archaeon]
MHARDCIVPPPCMDGASTLFPSVSGEQGRLLPAPRGCAQAAPPAHVLRLLCDVSCVPLACVRAAAHPNHHFTVFGV